MNRMITKFCLAVAWLLLGWCFSPGELKAQIHTPIIGNYEITQRSTSNLPLKGDYKKSLVQQILTSAEIGRSGNITALSLKLSRIYPEYEMFNVPDVKIYMKEVTRESYLDTSDYEDMSDATLVYEGDFACLKGNVDQWLKVELDTPFAYDGEKNLMIAFFDENDDKTFFFPFLRVETTDFTSFSFVNFESLDIANLGNADSSKETAKYHSAMRLSFDEGDEAVIDFPIPAYGEDYSEQAPVRTTARHSLDQQIFTAEEIGHAGYIFGLDLQRFDTGIKLYPGMKIFMKHVEKSEFADENDMVPLTDEDLVYEGDSLVNRYDVQGSSTSRMLDKNFHYNGKDNLLVAIWKSSDDTEPFNFFVNKSEGRHLSYYDDTEVPDPTDPDGFTGSKEMVDLRSNLTLYIRDEHAKPSQIRFISETYEGETYEWQVYGTEIGWQVVFGEMINWQTPDYDTLTPIDIDTNQFTITGLPSDSWFFMGLRAVYEDGVSEWVNLSGKTAPLPEVTDVTVFDIDNDEATISWTGEAENYTVILKKGTEVIDELPTTETSLTLEGLEQETQYEVTVKGDYRNGESNMSEPVTFTTTDFYSAPIALSISDITSETANVQWRGHAISYNLRYCTITGETITLSEDFEAEDALPGDWTFITMGDRAVPDKEGWFLDLEPENSTSTNQVAVSYSWYNSTMLNVMNAIISPKIALDGILSFKVKTNSMYPDQFAVMVSTKGTEIPDFENVLRPFAAGAGGWEELTFDLSTFGGQEGYIAIIHMDMGREYVAIDDVKVSQPIYGEWVEMQNLEETTAALESLESETKYLLQVQGVYEEGKVSEWTEIVEFTTEAIKPVPADLAVSNITETTATVTWTGEAESYKVRYRTADTESEWIELETTELSAALTELTADTRYEVQVQGVYEEGKVSEWTEIVEFTTEAIKPVPADLAVSNITETTATVTWTGEAESYKVRYRKTVDESLPTDEVNEEEWMEFEIVELTTTLEKLTPDTSYEVQVQGVYNQGASFSEWSASVILTTLPEEVDAIEDLVSEDGKAKEIYTLNGIRLEKRPTRSGIYLINGKKVFLK